MGPLSPYSPYIREKVYGKAIATRRHLERKVKAVTQIKKAVIGIQTRSDFFANDGVFA